MPVNGLLGMVFGGHVEGSCNRVGVGLGSTMVGGTVGNGNGLRLESGLA